ncbi:hypothetical protein AQUCO_00900131v1 [Aquilegia coerulea]|uniref:GDSL esterase/lipase n=1 Tax=Aquilegia coerulea TaxID=218851 RepID=A0A2G5EC50_AQUCA|nr:hypothetical protein AQUCO_00900131v1 [Aquilegia coerulea]
MTMSNLNLLLLSFFFITLARCGGETQNNSSVSALFILGDSSVNCGNNGLFSNFLHDRSSIYPCVGFETRLLPDLLGDKLGLPMIPPFYGQNGSIEGLLSGLNFGSSQATIINTGNLAFQALNHQLRQLYETLQMLQMQLGQTKSSNLVQSSLFYISLGKDDYIQLFLHKFSSLRHKYSGGAFAHILVQQMIRVVKDLYNANARKIIVIGIGPLGCAPRALWESYNSTAHTNADDRHCVQEINELILQYNAMLSEHLLELNYELFDAQIVFCDVYQGMLQIINNPKRYGFSDVRRACCGLGRYGGMVGCVSKEMACDDPSLHVWWDFYNPTQGVNSLLANWTWSGQPSHLCQPIDIKHLASSSAEHFNRAARSD